MTPNIPPFVMDDTIFIVGKTSESDPIPLYDLEEFECF